VACEPALTECGQEGPFWITLDVFGCVKYFELPALHAGQQHVPLAALALPDSSPQG
jgi:hypothetical protein